MAKLSAHGIELARRELPTGRLSLRSDGQILRDSGSGWKLYKRLKPGVDAVTYATKFKAFTTSLPASLRDYIDALSDAVSISHRLRLHTAISLMPDDPDGVWSEMDTFSGSLIEFAEAARLCRLYKIANIEAQLKQTEQLS